MWTLAAKLPNSDLNFSVDSWWSFCSFFSEGKGPQNPPRNSARHWFGTIPLGFLQKHSLEKFWTHQKDLRAWEKKGKKRTHIHEGILGIEMGVPNRPVLATKKLSLCALSCPYTTCHCHFQKELRRGVGVGLLVF